MTNKERIIELSKCFNTTEIAEICGVSVSYVCRVLRQHNPKTLTPTNYINALLLGLTSNEQIAQFFEVSPSTLKRFKRKYNLKAAAAKYLYISGVSIERVKSSLHLSNAEINTLETLGSFEEIKRTLHNMQTVLQLHKGEFDQIDDQLKVISQLLKILNC